MSAIVRIDILEDLIECMQASFIRSRADIVLCSDLQPMRDGGKIEQSLICLVICLANTFSKYFVNSELKLCFRQSFFDNCAPGKYAPDNFARGGGWPSGMHSGLHVC